MKIKNTMITEATASTIPAAETETKRLFHEGCTFRTPAQEEAAKALEKALTTVAENKNMDLPDYEPARVDLTGTITIKGGRLTDTIGSYVSEINIHPDGTYSTGLRVCDITCNVKDDIGENSNRYWFGFGIPGEHNSNYCSGINNIDNMLWAIDTAIKTRVNEALTTASTINDLDAIKAQLAELNALYLWADSENIDIYRLWRPDDTRATMIEKLKAIRDGVVDKKPDGRLCTIDPQRVALCCLTCRQYGVNCSGMDCKRDVGDSECVYRLHNPDAPAPVGEYNRRVAKYHATATVEVEEEDTTIKDYIDGCIASLREKYGDYLTDLLVPYDIYDTETTDEVDAIIERIDTAANCQNPDCYMIDTAEGYIVGDVYGIMSGNINGVDTDDPFKIADALISHYGEDWRRDWISTKEDTKKYVYDKLIVSRNDTDDIMYCTVCPYFERCDLIHDCMLDIVSGDNYPN